MDPPIFIPYSPPNGLPQESKLATYMNRSATIPTNHSLSHALSNLTMESPPTPMKKVVLPEYYPMNYFTPQVMLPESPQHSPPPPIPIMAPAPQVHQENVGGTTYFYATNPDAGVLGGNPMGADVCMVGGMQGAVNMSSVSPYACQMYPGAPTHIPLLGQKPGLATTFYMPDVIQAELYERNEELYMPNTLRQYPDLPENVDIYSDLIPMENAPPHSMATSFRVTHRESAEFFAMRRLPAFNGGNTKALEAWKGIDHPNIVKLHDFFTTNAFNDHSMVLVYDYHAGNTTIMDKYLYGGLPNAGPSDSNVPTFHDPFSSDPDAPRPYTHKKNAMLRAVACGALLPEAVIWSIIVQLTAALRAIHTASLACRTLDPTKVIIAGSRIRLAWCGALDAIHPPYAGCDIGQAQQDDLTALGHLILSLSSRCNYADNVQASIDLVSRSYSADLKNLILYLLTNSPGRRTVIDLMPMIGARFYTQVEALESRTDVCEVQLAKEIDNGRLLRILYKLGLVNERPELNMDPTWSETGDRYMLKLFRDYVFHSVSMDGRPWLDQAHITYCLNQLDGGTSNSVQLVTRDEQSLLVVSYAELKQGLDRSFEEVFQASLPIH